MSLSFFFLFSGLCVRFICRRLGHDYSAAVFLDFLRDIFYWLLLSSLFCAERGIVCMNRA